MKYTYTLDGVIIKEEEENKDVFVKMLDPSSSHLEKTIARLVKDNQPPNLVSIYNITNDFIEMELLDTDIETNIKNNKACFLISDITNALQQLHSMNIVYIDLKIDNLGYSEIDACWKLFDFDSSGILEENSNNNWLMPPPIDRYAYTNYVEQIKDNNMYYFDKYGLCDLCSQLSEIYMSLC
jgi:serine/threonine protein kinase